MHGTRNARSGSTIIKGALRSLKTPRAQHGTASEKRKASGSFFNRQRPRALRRHVQRVIGESRGWPEEYSGHAEIKNM